MKNLHTALHLILITGFLGCGTTEVTKLPKISRSSTGSFQAEIQSDTYIIRQGDQIDIVVWGYPEFNTKTMVKETGTVTIPLLGEITAAGFSKEQFHELMIKKLSQYIKGEANLTISIVSSITQKVTVLGYVGRQENYPLMNDVTLLEMLSIAGGTTSESDLHHVKIIPFGGSGQPIEVDLTWYIENGNVDAIPKVRPGDTVFVPKKENVVREVSDFLRDAFLLFGFFRLFN